MSWKCAKFLIFLLIVCYDTALPDGINGTRLINLVKWNCTSGNCLNVIIFFQDLDVLQELLKCESEWNSDVLHINGTKARIHSLFGTTLFLRIQPTVPWTIFCSKVLVHHTSRILIINLNRSLLRTRNLVRTLSIHQRTRTMAMQHVKLHFSQRT